jgi:hypothetical protein
MPTYDREDTGDMSEPGRTEDAARLEETINMLRDRAQVALDGLTREVQANPVRTLAIVGVVGFILASSLRRGVLPAMLKSGLGVAAAVALRQAAERGLAGMWNPTARESQTLPD